MDYILKNGPIYVSNEIRKDLFKIRNLESFSYFEETVDKGASIREKSEIITTLI